MLRTPTDFSVYNGFYERADSRQVVFSLYRGICQVCGRPIDDLGHMDLAHRVPRSHRHVFEEVFDGLLDIDNLLNLQAEHVGCNRSKSNSYVHHPTMFQAAIDHAARLIDSRLPSSAMPTIHTVADIGLLVKERREAQGLRQVDLAKRAKVGPRFVLDLEKGKPTVQAVKMFQVLAALGITLAEEGMALSEAKQNGGV